MELRIDEFLEVLARISAAAFEEVPFTFSVSERRSEV